MPLCFLETAGSLPFLLVYPKQQAAVALRGEGAGEGGGVEAIKLRTSLQHAAQASLWVLDPLAWFSSRSRPQAEPRESAQSTAREAGQLGCGVEAHRDRRQITCHFILATPATFPNHPGRGELIAILKTSQKQR